VTTNVWHWWRFDVTTSLGFDIPAAVGNVVLVLLLGKPVLLALRRVHRRAAFDAPVELG
jgi:energy-coupling factor transport system substrate-specific component